MPRQTPIRKSLERKATMMGVDHTLFGVEVLLGAVFLASKVYIGFVALFFLHIVLKWLHSRDQDWFKAYEQYSREADVYDPWPRAKALKKRPKGFGRDLWC